jgi:hypothetical protein
MMKCLLKTKKKTLKRSCLIFLWFKFYSLNKWRFYGVVKREFQFLLPVCQKYFKSVVVVSCFYPFFNQVAVNIFVNIHFFTVS